MRAWISDRERALVHMILSRGMAAFWAGLCAEMREGLP